MDKLKKLAERLGYTTNPADEDGVTIDYKGHWFDFDPLTNNDQFVEVLEYFKMSVTWVGDKKCWLAWPYKRPFTHSTGATPQEAVINAALAIGDE